MRIAVTSLSMPTDAHGVRNRGALPCSTDWNSSCRLESDLRERDRVETPPSVKEVTS